MTAAAEGLGRMAVALVLASALVAGSGPAMFAAERVDDDLDSLFAQLREARTPEEASLVEDRIYDRWSRSGDVAVDSIYQVGLMAVVHGDYTTALGIFVEVTERAPQFAEGWNKRASVEYQLGDIEGAMRDVERAIEIERRHFGALSGLALIQLARGEEQGALRMFERALELNPASPTLRRQVDRLRSKLGFRSV